MKKIYRQSVKEFHSFFRQGFSSDLALLILFTVYLVLGRRIPLVIAQVIDSIPGKLLVAAIVIVLFQTAHPIVAILSIFVAFDLFRRSSLATGNESMVRYSPSEANKSEQLSAFNQFPYTLEQQMVKEMAPIPQSGNALGNATYKPMLEKQHQAASILRT